MPGICTAAVRDGGGACEHLTLTVDLDGEPVTVKTGEHDPEWQAALTADEKRQMLRLLARWWKAKGGNLADFVGRVLAGEEGHNLRVYTFFGPGAALTKTNIGTAYVNVPIGLNGERIYVNFAGVTEFRGMVNANFVGTGPWQIRIVRDGDNAVLYESPSLTQTGERELDSGWAAIPGGFSGETFLRIQARSNVATDDPVFRRAELGLR